MLTRMLRISMSLMLLLITAICVARFYLADYTSLIATLRDVTTGDMVLFDTERLTLINLTSHIAPIDSFAWSPDGQQVAFVAAEDSTLYLFHMALADLEPHRIAPVFNMIDAMFQWSSDSNAIFYPALSGDLADIYRYDIAAQTSSNITNTLDISEFGVQVTPDNRVMLMIETRISPTQPLLTLLNLQDGTRFPLTQTYFMQTSYVWSPDGEQIAYKNLNAVVLYNRDGEQIRRYPLGINVLGFPRWSHDGTQLAFLSDRNTIGVLDMDSAEIQILSSPSRTRLSPPEWTSDGRYLSVMQVNLENRTAAIMYYDLVNNHIDHDFIPYNMANGTIQWMP